MPNVHCVIQCTVNENNILCLINPILTDDISKIRAISILEIISLATIAHN